MTRREPWSARQVSAVRDPGARLAARPLAARRHGHAVVDGTVAPAMGFQPRAGHGSESACRRVRSAGVVAGSRPVRDDGRRAAHPAHDLAQRRAGHRLVTTRRRACAPGSGGSPHLRAGRAHSHGRNLPNEGGTAQGPGSVVYRHRRPGGIGGTPDRGAALGAPSGFPASVRRPPTTFSSTSSRDPCSSSMHTRGASCRVAAGRMGTSRTSGSRMPSHAPSARMQRCSASSMHCSSSTASVIAGRRPGARAVRWRRGVGSGRAAEQATPRRDPGIDAAGRSFPNRNDEADP